MSASRAVATTAIVALCAFAGTAPAGAEGASADAGSRAIMVRDIFAGPRSSSPTSLANVNGRLWFAARDAAHGQEPWKSDGTLAGTTLVADIAPPGGYLGGDSDPGSFVGVDGTAVFTAAIEVEGDEGPEARGPLWRSDGSPTGTTRVLPGTYSAQEFTQYKGSLFFLGADTGPDQDWWLQRLDNDTASNVMVKRLELPFDFVRAGRTLFLVGNPLWKSDGTSRGTVRVRGWADYEYGSTAILDHVAVNGTLFFSLDSVDAVGTELWKSDGTRAGTVLVKDIYPGRGSSDPQGLTNVDGTFYFSADDGGHGRELWKSDGTARGTVRVKDVQVGRKSSFPSQLTPCNGQLFFAAREDEHGRELWRTNGTRAGTTLLRDLKPGRADSYPTQLTCLARGPAFAANDGKHGRELWTSDGTASGFTLHNLVVGSSAPIGLTPVGRTLFFTARDPVHGRELWTLRP